MFAPVIESPMIGACKICKDLMRAGKSVPFERPRTSFDLNEIFNLQSLGLRVVSFDRDLRVTVAEEARHLVQRRAGIGTALTRPIAIGAPIFLTTFG
jgi:hypothetical protein